MRLVLAWICYWLGDFISLTGLRMGIGYRLYNRLMRWSSELDDKEVIWKPPSE